MTYVNRLSPDITENGEISYRDRIQGKGYNSDFCISCVFDIPYDVVLHSCLVMAAVWNDLSYSASPQRNKTPGRLRQLEIVICNKSKYGSIRLYGADWLRSKCNR